MEDRNMEEQTEEIKQIEKVEEKKPKWTDEVFITIPLTEIFKLKKKINKLKKKNDSLDKRFWDKYHECQAMESKYNAVMKDYQKLLGIKSQEKGDDEK